MRSETERSSKTRRAGGGTPARQSDHESNERRGGCDAPPANVKSDRDVLMALKTAIVAGGLHILRAPYALEPATLEASRILDRVGRRLTEEIAAAERESRRKNAA